MGQLRTEYGQLSPAELLSSLGTTSDGLSSASATARLAATGKGRPAPGWPIRAITLFASQFRSPITIILIGAAFLSMLLRDAVDSGIILVIVFAGAILGFWQEFSAANALAALSALVSTRVSAVRDCAEIQVPTDTIVSGDIVLLSAGSMVPGDCRILESEDLFVNESALTGESYPAEKCPGELPVETPLPKRTNVLFQGTHVISGTARAVVVLTGQDTQLGQIGGRLHLRPPENDFERGVRRFGYFLMEVTLLLILFIFAIHLFMRHSALQAFLFSLALAVGLTPQLLPAIISVNLAQGAKRLAACKVIVRRLSAIENLGSMNVFCCDKTGTLTEGVMSVEGCLDWQGKQSERALYLAGLNAAFETGFTNPVDEALRASVSISCGSV
jgi:Mg2+-importing ATPase